VAALVTAWLSDLSQPLGRSDRGDRRISFPAGHDLAFQNIEIHGAIDLARHRVEQIPVEVERRPFAVVPIGNCLSGDAARRRHPRLPAAAEQRDTNRRETLARIGGQEITMRHGGYPRGLPAAGAGELLIPSRQEFRVFVVGAPSADRSRHMPGCPGNRSRGSGIGAAGRLHCCRAP
jgi:hypothetical protein